MAIKKARPRASTVARWERGWTYKPMRGGETDPAYTHEVAATNRAISDADLKWGRGRLPLIVSADLGERFQAQFTRWLAACHQGSIEEVRAHGGAMRRAYVLMDQEATRAGAKPMVARSVDGIDSTGRRVVVVMDPTDLTDQGDGAEVWTMEALIGLIEANRDPVVDAALEAFPGGVIEDYRLREEWDEKIGDPIPEAMA